MTSLRLRLRRWARAVVVTAVAALVVALWPVSVSAAVGVQYVALGDSYASGVGSGNYLAAGGDCEQSSRAYPQLWADAHRPASYVSMACAGATIADVAAHQLSALRPETTLVSLTVGGNDVGFSTVLSHCVRSGTGRCVKDIAAAEDEARTRLPAELDALYSEISARSPLAEVVVLNYPRFYDTATWFCVGLSKTSRRKINEGADVLDDVIAQAATRHAFTVADVRSHFAGHHEICDGSSWLHSVDWSHLDESYHPTSKGQSGAYLPSFDAVTDPARGGNGQN